LERAVRVGGDQARVAGALKKLDLGGAQRAHLFRYSRKTPSPVSSLPVSFARCAHFLQAS
jgi:hypothetical protein